jgi:glycosyltransferase involved in cell wall biosynthesis
LEPGPPRDQETPSMVADAARFPAILFIWDRFGPYHLDRCEAVAARLAGRYAVYGIEIASFDNIYQWEKSGAGHGFKKITLFPHRRRNSVSQAACLAALLRTCLGLRPRVVFACNYEDPVIFLTSALLRLTGKPVVVMQDSKFDDRPRRLWWEAFKLIGYAPYAAAIVGSPRSAGYMQFLGFRPGRILVGYDTTSVARIRALAGAPPAPAGMPHAARHFTIIARFIAKKNLGMALDAYARYARGRVGTPRELHLCGAGELEDELRAQCENLSLSGVRFRGFLQERDIAGVLASSLALILPSIEEQHGLAVNEAVAMGVPVLVSDNCGARDLLVRSGVNGYVFEPDNIDGLAHFMTLLDADAEEWKRLARGSAGFVAAADAPTFATTVERAIALFERTRLYSEQPA